MPVYGGRAMAKAATPWGPAELVEELTVAQRAGDKRFSSVVQLLEAPGGLAVPLELGQQLLVGEVATFAVLDRDRQRLARLAPARERRVGALRPKVDVAAEELERRVRAQGAGQQARLAEDLEAVADP